MQHNVIINLESLLELSARLNETHSKEFILNSTLLSLMGKLKVLRAGVLVPNNKGLKLYLSKGKFTPDYLEFDIEKCMGDYSTLRTTLEQYNIRFVFPVEYREKIFAFICLGDRLLGTELSGEEEKYARLVCTISANALQNAEHQQSLIQEKITIEQRNQLLTTLFEMSRDFSNLLSKKEIIKMLSFHLMGQLMVNRFAIFQIENNKIEDAYINRFEELEDISFLNRMTRIKEPVVCNNSNFGENFTEYCKKYNINVIAPMFIQGNPKALLVIGKKMNGSEFTDENLQFIEALGNTAISTLESERLFKEEIEKKKLENELNLALDIQKNLLPKNVPNVKYFEIHGISLPSRHVGGDYYDFIKLDENRTIVAIADVSGKGMPAALLMANVQAALRVIAPLGLPLREIVQRLNKIVYLNTSSDKFVTFFMGILDSEHKTFEYINAGHNPPFILHSDLHIEHLTAGGLILGFMDDPFEYEQAVVKLEQDSVICMFTDGITEALNTSNLEYGDERLQELVRDIRKFPVEEMLKIIVEDVQQFAIGTQQFDDITLIGVKVI